VSYRAHSGLLRAMRQFARNKRGSAFYKRIVRLERRSYERLVDLLLTNVQDIHHPEPRIAVSLGMMMVVSTLQELVIDTPSIDCWRDLLPANDDALRIELTRALLSYLGVERA
jgi:hypothetical protein